MMDIVEVLVKFEATTCGVENLDDFRTVPEEECVVLLVGVEILLVRDINAAVEIDIVVGEEDILVDFIVGLEKPEHFAHILKNTLMSRK